jgi:hypothetical protein
MLGNMGRRPSVRRIYGPNTIGRRVRLETVSVEIRTSLCQHRELLPGKRLPRAETGRRLVGDTSRFRATEIALSRVSGGKAAGSQRRLHTTDSPPGTKSPRVAADIDTRSRLRCF